MPHLRTTLIERTGLTTKLNSSVDKKFTLISAPAGFSKSTLVSNWLRNSEYTYCWFSLDNEDNDAMRFLGHLFTALEEVSGMDLLSFLQTDKPVDIEQCMALLVNELVSLEKPVICVLDDFHLIDNADISHGIKFLLDNHPQYLHLVLLTREDPSFSLSSYRARDELLEIRTHDLSFSYEQCKAFFNQIMALNLSDDEIEQLQEKTEGWPVGLQLTALALKKTENKDKFLSSLTHSHRYVLDYLVEEVLNNLNQEQQYFLLHTSFLSRFNADLCNAMLGIDNARNMLDEFEKSNLFVISLDNKQCWYRYHHLFADVLKIRCDAGSKPAQTARVKACQWLEENEYIIEAIDYAVEAQDPHLPLKLIEAYWSQLRLRNSEQMIARWVDQLDVTLVERYPVVNFYWGFYLLSVEPQKAKTIIDKAKASIDKALNNADYFVYNKAEFALLNGALDVAYAYYYGAENEPQKTIYHAQKAISFFNHDNFIWHSSALALLSIAYMNTHQFALAKPIIQGCIQDLSDDDTGTIISFYTLLVGMELIQTDFKAAQNSCEQALALVKKNFHRRSPPGTANIYVYLANLAVERNECQQAKNLLQEMSQLDGFSHLSEQRSYELLVKAKLSAIDRDPDQSHMYLQQLKELNAVNPVADVYSIDALIAKFDLYFGRIEKAEAWFSSIDLSIETAPSTLIFDRLVVCNFLLIRYRQRHYTDDLQLANSLLQQMLTDACLMPPKYRCEALLLLSLVSHRLGLEHQVIDQLNRAIEIAQDNKYIRAVIDSVNLHPSLADLLNSHLSTHTFIKALLPKHPSQANTENHTQNQEIILSEREFEVLKMLDSELSGPEIAASLYISINTLRTHTKSIYSKLETKTRRATIIRAKSLNLI